MNHSKNKPKREPLSRLWFLARGYTQAPLDLMHGEVTYVHPHTNTALNKYGVPLTLQLVPLDRHMKTKAKYLKFNRERGGKYLAHVKYITFKGAIPPGYEVDHIDGNTLNNDIRNLRIVPKAINRRDGGFLRKLRNKGIRPDCFAGVLLVYFDRMAQFKASHTKRQYNNLTRDDLLRMLIGPTFTVVDPDIVMDLDFTRHREL